MIGLRITLRVRKGVVGVMVRVLVAVEGRERGLELKRARNREVVRRWRERNLELNRKRQILYFRKWRDSHRDKHRAIRNAQQTVPLGGCCELCGCEGGLMRFLVDYNYPKIVVTVCRGCRGWARRSLRVLDGGN